MQVNVAGGILSQHSRVNHRRALLHGGPCVRLRRWVTARAEPEGGKPDGSFESLFSKELQRRGLSSMDGDDSGLRPTESSGGTSSSGSSSGPFSSSSGGGTAPGANPFAASSSPGSSTRTRPRSAPPPMAASAADAGGDQRQKSMDMVNEGLEGLLPRAKLLLQLGGSVFLGFLPFMLVFSLLFSGVYSVFGTSFVHGGREMSSPPAYIDPERLLSEPTVDPYVPYNSNPYSSPDLQ